MLDMALVGIGRWGSRLVDSVRNTSDTVRFVAAATRDPARHEDFAARFDIRLATFKDVLADPQVEAVLLTTPHSQHRDQVRAAAAAGKHVFVEKPLALTRADAEAAIAACRTAGVAIGHGFNRRFSPAYAEMARRLVNGDLGELVHVEGQFSGPSGFMLKPGMWRADRNECPGGAVTARGIHVLDAMIHFAGPVSEVFARSRRQVIDVPVDDVTSASLAFRSGVTGYLASHHVSADIWRIQLYGSKGWIEMRGDDQIVFKPVKGEPETRAMPDSDWERAELEAFADAVAGRAAFPVTDEEAINGVAVVEAIPVSAAENRPVAIG